MLWRYPISRCISGQSEFTREVRRARRFVRLQLRKRARRAVSFGLRKIRSEPSAFLRRAYRRALVKTSDFGRFVKVNRPQSNRPGKANRQRHFGDAGRRASSAILKPSEIRGGDRTRASNGSAAGSTSVSRCDGNLSKRIRSETSSKARLGKRFTQTSSILSNSAFQVSDGIERWHCPSMFR